MDDRPQLRPRATELSARLGLNVHRERWPTAPALKAYEAAGLSWVQVHTPPRAMLADRELCRRHARALRAVLDTCGLRLVLHAPDDLSAGTIEHDRAFEGLLEYASLAGAELIAYHGLNFVDADGPAAARIRERAQLEERSLQRFSQRAHTLGITIAVENLAPVHPSPPTQGRLCHDPRAVRDLVRRIDSPALGMLLDLGHLHVTADASRTDAAMALAAVASDVVLFHVHDNLGARRHDVGAPGIDPLRLDLHLPPGQGSLPWRRLAGVLCDHPAPLVLEVEPSHRPELAALVTVTSHLLLDGRQRAERRAAAAA
jgi:sugar phosphate isomerase/epimerase